jgi:hypothetical protein
VGGGGAGPWRRSAGGAGGGGARKEGGKEVCVRGEIRTKERKDAVRKAEALEEAGGTSNVSHGKQKFGAHCLFLTRFEANAFFH